MEKVRAGNGPFGSSRYSVVSLGTAAEVTLGKMIESADAGSQREVPYIKAANVRDGRVAVQELGTMWASESDIGRLNVRTHDLFVIEGGATAGRVSRVLERPPADAIFQNSVHRIRPRGDNNGRYLLHVLSCLPSSGWYDAICNTSTFKHLTSEKMKALRVPLPSPEEQLAIADFLDRETARIDALIAKKVQMRQTLGEWEQAKHLRAVLDWRQEKSRTLRQYGTRVFTGPFGTLLAASEYTTSGVPLINPTHIIRGRLVPESNISVPPEVAVRLSRYRLRSGDLVMGRKGDVGRAAIVPPEADGWICGSDSIAIRTDPDSLQTEFLAAVLNLSLYRQQLEAHSTGAMVANVNESVLLRLRIPDLSLEEQDSAVHLARESAELFQRAADTLQTQISLLQEHRQALITTAVTGQLNISKAA